MRATQDDGVIVIELEPAEKIRLEAYGKDMCVKDSILRNETAKIGETLWVEVLP